MDKLRVGIMMDDCLPVHGGGYSYYQRLFSAINQHLFHEDIEIFNLNFFKTVPGNLQLNKPVIEIKKTIFGSLAYQFLYFLYKLVHHLLKSSGKKWLEIITGFMDGINNRAAARIMRKENIHLVYYLKPHDNLVNYPMIVTHWDVGHKSMYPFPEVAWNGNYERRERYYEKILTRAFLILCESETGARELQKYYAINPDKIRVLPIFSSDTVHQKVSEQEQAAYLKRHGLVSEKFFVYPAQFWAHKNHATLIRAFGLLTQSPENDFLKLVLCGGDQGNLSYVKDIIDTLKLNNKIILPGFISSRELYTLYKNAVALIMPTFLGPTNIPLIEAAELQCAVLCSNLDGHKELLGTNALYFDPASATEISHCLEKILDRDIRKQLVSSAYHHIKDSVFQIEKSIHLLDHFLQQIKPVRKAWA